jgi:enoyl-CoA hydratase
VAENAVFGALERRWNIVAGDGMTVRLPLVVGWGRAMEMIVTGRPVDAEEALRIGLANEVVPRGKALPRAVELGHEIARLPQGAIRSDKETMIGNVGRSLDGRPRPPCRCSCAGTRTRRERARSSSAARRSGPTTACRGG